MKKFTDYWPELIGSLIFLIIIAGIIFITTGNYDSKFIYDMDDAYIHMAVAKNMALYHSWGIGTNGFVPLSSSLLWPSLIYLCYLIFGVNELSPLILNLIAAIGLIFLAGQILKRFKIGNSASFIIILSLIFLTPLPVVVFSGMEHVAHTLLNIAYIFVAAKALSYSSSGIINTWDDTRRYRYLLYPLSFFLVAARYEGMFAIGIVSLLFIFRRRYFTAVANVIIGILSITAFGFYSMAKGWYFLPTSLMLKGSIPEPVSIVNLLKYPAIFIVHLLFNIHLFVVFLAILIILYIMLSKKENLWDEMNILPLLFIIVTILHMQFASSGWLYRYESYLMALGIMIIGITIAKGELPLFGNVTYKYRLLQNILAVFIVFIAISPLLKRGYSSVKDIVIATSNVYGQQYQMGLFLNKYYNNRPVAIADIGAVNYWANMDCIDLVGLGNREVVEARMKMTYNVKDIERICREKDMALAIVSEETFGRANIGGLPKSWIAVGRWYIPNNVINIDDHVTFYALDESKASELADNLREFSDQLPKYVRQCGIYTELSD